MIASRRSAARSVRLDAGLGDWAFGLGAFSPRRPLADFSWAIFPVAGRELAISEI
jgi:hypothetical protein